MASRINIKEKVAEFDKEYDTSGAFRHWNPFVDQDRIIEALGLLTHCNVTVDDDEALMLPYCPA